MQPQPVVLVVGAAQPERPVYVKPGEVPPTHGKEAAAGSHGCGRRTLKGLFIAALCVGAALGIGLGVGLKASEAAPAPSGQTVTPATLYTVSSSLTLAGLTSSTFSSAARIAFKSSVASTLGVQTSAVAVTQVTDITTARRRALAIGVAVNFTITTTSVSAQQSVSTSISTFASNASVLTTFTSTLNIALAAVGAPTVTNVGAPAKPIMTTVTTVTPSPPPPSPTTSPTPTPTTSPTPTPTPSSIGGIVFNINAALALGVPSRPAPPGPGANGRHLLAAPTICCNPSNGNGCYLNSSACGNALSTCTSPLIVGNSTCPTIQPPTNVCGCSGSGNQNQNSGAGNQSLSYINGNGSGNQSNNGGPNLTSASLLALTGNNSLASAVAAPTTGDSLGTVTSVYLWPFLNLTVVYASQSVVNGASCFLLLVNRTTGSPTCLHNSSFIQLQRRNTNGGTSLNFGDDVQFDAAGNIYWIGTPSQSSLDSLVYTNPVTLVTKAIVTQPAINKFTVVPSTSMVLTAACYSQTGSYCNVSATRLYDASSGAFSFVCRQPYVWALQASDNNFYLGFIPDGSCEATGCNPPPGVYQYIPGATNLTAAAWYASSTTNGGNFPTGASPSNPAAPSYTVQGVCPTCDVISAANIPAVARMDSGNILTAWRLKTQIQADYISPPPPGFDQFYGIPTGLAEVFPVPRLLSPGPFKNISSLTALSGLRAAVFGQNWNGTYTTTLYSRTNDTHFALTAATGVQVTATSFSNATGILYLSGLNSTVNSTFGSVALLKVNISSLSVVVVNTTGITNPFQSFSSF